MMVTAALAAGGLAMELALVRTPPASAAPPAVQPSPETAAATPSDAGESARTWEFRSGGWPEVVAPVVQPPPAADATLLRVEALLQQNRASAARSEVLRWLKANPAHPLRDRGLLLMAKALYQYGDRIRAFYYCDELMDTYPESPLFYPALELQYRIADAYLKGYKSRFLRIPMFEQKDEAVEMLFRIQRRSPGSPLAEQALLRTADYYYDSGQFDLAADTYAAYARTYPRSPELSRVLLLQAYSNLALYRGPRFDPTPLIDAQQQLRDYSNRFPQQAREEQVPELLEQIELDQARKLFLTGDFYQRTHKPQAARHLYRRVLEDHPQSPQAQQARERLDRLNPEPPAPATAPTAALP